MSAEDLESPRDGVRRAEAGGARDQTIVDRRDLRARRVGGVCHYVRAVRLGDVLTQAFRLSTKRIMRRCQKYALVLPKAGKGRRDFSWAIGSDREGLDLSNAWESRLRSRVARCCTRRPTLDPHRDHCRHRTSHRSCRACSASSTKSLCFSPSVMLAVRRRFEIRAQLLREKHSLCQ